MIISYTCTILVLIMSFFWFAESTGLKQLTPPLGVLMETPNWSHSEQVLYMVDIIGSTLHQYNPETGKVVSKKMPGGPIGLIMPLANAPKGHVLIGLLNCLYTCDFNNPTDLRFILCVDGSKPGNLIHEAKCDAKQRLWFGTIGKLVGTTGGPITPDQGSLYMVTNTTYRCPEVKKHPVSLSDGITWSPDNKKMYYNDQPTRKIISWDYDLETGEIANTKDFFDFDKNLVPGTPNGMTIDTEGNIWVANTLGKKVMKINPDTAKVTQDIVMPSPVTSIVFGGANFTTLYITTLTTLWSWTDGKTQGYPLNFMDIHNDCKN